MDMIEAMENALTMSENEEIMNNLRVLSKDELINCYVKCVELYLKEECEDLKEECEDVVDVREGLRNRTEANLISQILLHFALFSQKYTAAEFKEILYILLCEETLSYDWRGKK